MINFWRKNGFAIAVLSAILTFYIVQVSRLRGWLIDDAGISFAYARNLAFGYGLVSQPGVLPVEGFSNPMWVFLLTIFAYAGFDIVEIVKPLSIILTICALVVFFIAFSRLMDSDYLALSVVAGLVVQPAFVIWSVGGLENPLLVFLVAISFYMCLLLPTPKKAVLAGILSGLTAITRPDGILYLSIYPVLHPKYSKQTLLSSLTVFGSYLVFRVAYFGEWLPNTYFMKAEGKTLGRTWLLALWGRLKSILLGLSGTKYLAAIIIFSVILLLLLILWKRKIDQRYITPTIFAAISIGGYLFMPSDWMGEYRFASAFFPFAYLLPCMLLSDVLSIYKGAEKKTGDVSQRKRTQPLIASCVILAGLAVLNFVSYIPRLENFTSNPTVNFHEVKADFYHFTRYASILNLEKPSVLLPDVGGVLYYYPEFRIYDLGGLVDGTVARTLGRNQQEFYDYIFETAEPDFIHVHGRWTYSASLDGDPRFLQRYTAIYKYIDSAMAAKYGIDRYSGDFVRNDRLFAPGDLEKLILEKP